MFSMSVRIIASPAGGMSSMFVPPRDDENSVLSLDTVTTSSYDSSAQYPGPSGSACQRTG